MFYTSLNLPEDLINILFCIEKMYQPKFIEISRFISVYGIKSLNHVKAIQEILIDHLLFAN